MNRRGTRLSIGNTLENIEWCWFNVQISNFTKIRPVETELFDLDGRPNRETERRDETNSRFTQFCGRDLEFKFKSRIEKVSKVF